jgi:hypothetical protein
LLLLFALGIGGVACGPEPLLDGLVKAPEFDPKGQAKCGVAKSQAEPLIVEWPDAARGKLESQVRKSVVAVRYIGCEMQVLGQCTAPGKYGYTSLNPKKSRVKISNADELYASIPAYAVKFEGTLARAGELNVEMTIVGRYEADHTGVRVEDLQGDCDGATHVVTGLSVGAFEFFAGADARAGAGVKAGDVGVEGKSTSSRETLNQDGKEEDCRKAAAADTIPPYGCGALLGLEVQRIIGAQPAVAAPPGPELARAPTTTSDTGTRFARDVDKGTVRDTTTGLTWTYKRTLGTHYEAVRSCQKMTDPRYALGSPSTRRDASFLGQDAVPEARGAWRLPTASELQAYLPQASSQGAIKLDDSDCLWAGDDESGAIARRSLLAQSLPPSTCVTRSGARKQSEDDGSFFCVKRR